MSTYLVSWHPSDQPLFNDNEELSPPCTREFPANVPFHTAVSQVLADAGPVELCNLPEEMRRAAGAGAYIDPIALVQVVSASLGYYGRKGEARQDELLADAPTPAHHLPPSPN